MRPDLWQGCRQAVLLLGVNINKENPSMEELVCYCFGYSAADIEEDVRLNGRSTILEKILSEKKAGACQCAVKNPKGR